MNAVFTFAGRDTTLQVDDVIVVTDPHGCVLFTFMRQGTKIFVNGKEYAKISLHNFVSAHDVCDLVAAVCGLRSVRLPKGDPHYKKNPHTVWDAFVLQKP